MQNTGWKHPIGDITEFFQGEFIGIMGPVGCGKSSILSAILAELSVHSGEISISQIDSGMDITYLFYINHSILDSGSWLPAGSAKAFYYFSKKMQTASLIFWPANMELYISRSVSRFYSLSIRFFAVLPNVYHAQWEHVKSRIISILFQLNFKRFSFFIQRDTSNMFYASKTYKSYTGHN